MTTDGVRFVLSKAPLEAGEKILSFPMPEGLDQSSCCDECMEVVTFSGRTIPAGPSASSVRATLKVKFLQESVGFSLVDLYQDGLTVDGLGARLAKHNKPLERAFYPSKFVPSFHYHRDTGNFFTILPGEAGVFTDDLVLAALLFPASDPSSTDNPPGGGFIGTSTSSKKTRGGVTGYWMENSSADPGTFRGATGVPQAKETVELLKVGQAILPAPARSQIAVFVGKKEWSSSAHEVESGLSPAEVLAALEEALEACLAETGLRSGLFSLDLVDDPAVKGRQQQPRIALSTSIVPAKDAKDSKFVLTLELELPDSGTPQVVEFAVAQVPAPVLLKIGDPAEADEDDPLENRYPIAFVANAAPSDGFISGRGPCNIMAMMLGGQVMVSKPCGRPTGGSRLTAVLIDRFHEDVVFERKAEIYLTLKFTKQEHGRVCRRSRDQDSSRRR